MSSKGSIMENKRKRLTLADKAAIIRKIEDSTKRTIICVDYEIRQDNITKILAMKEKILQATKNPLQNKKKSLAKPCFVEIESKLVNWIDDCNSKGIKVTVDLIRHTALELATQDNLCGFSASNGWIQKFMDRNNIANVKIHGEEGSVSETTVTKWINSLNDRIDNFEESDIFNLDELGLFFKLTAARTYALKGKKLVTGKHSKVRVTVLLGSNMDGSEKLPPLLIGKSEKPRCIKNLAKTPLIYRANNKSWMTSALFREYMKNLNKKFRNQKRKVIFFMDNCPSHPHDMNFSNIQIAFFPKNCTSVLQPMDRGVIRSFKSYYRRLLYKHIALERELNPAADVKVLEKTISILNAMIWTKSAWDSVTIQTIQNCFRKAGFKKSETIHVCPESDIELVEDDNYLKNLEVPFNEFVSFDDHLRTHDSPTADDNSDTEIDDNDDEIEDEEIEDIVKQPSFEETMNAVKILKRYSLFHEFPEDFVKYLGSVDSIIFKNHLNCMKQTKITNFFNPQN